MWLLCSNSSVLLCLVQNDLQTPAISVSWRLSWPYLSCSPSFAPLLPREFHFVLGTQHNRTTFPPPPPPFFPLFLSSFFVFWFFLDWESSQLLSLYRNTFIHGLLSHSLQVFEQPFCFEWGLPWLFSPRKQSYFLLEN